MTDSLCIRRWSPPLAQLPPLPHHHRRRYRRHYRHKLASPPEIICKTYIWTSRVHYSSSDHYHPGNANSFRMVAITTTSVSPFVNAGR